MNDTIIVHIDPSNFAEASNISHFIKDSFKWSNERCPSLRFIKSEITQVECRIVQDQEGILIRDVVSEMLHMPVKLKFV